VIELPLAERELTRSGKRRSTYMLRLAPVALTCLVLAVTWLWGLALNTGLESAAGTMATFLANLARVFQYFAVFAVGPLLTAGLIAQEKQERTLSLLLMADFRGWDLYLAKFVSAFLQVELLILSMLPLLAIASFLGGVSVPMAAGQILLLSLAALATCALGLLSSTVCNRPIDAFLLTLLLLFGWMVVSGMGSAVLGPVLGHSLNIAETAWSPSTMSWLPSAAVTALLAAGASLAAIKLLPLQAHEGAKRPRSARRRAQPSTKVPFLTRRRRKVEPLTELLFAGGGERMFGGSRAMRVLFAAFLALTALSCGVWVILIAALYDTISSLAAIHQSSVMEDLRTTPLDGDEFAKALLRAQRLRCRLYLPAVMVSTLRDFGMSGGQMLVGFGEHPAYMVLGLAIALVMGVLVVAPVHWRFIVTLGCNASTWGSGVVSRTVLAVLGYCAINLLIAVAYVPLMIAWGVFAGPRAQNIPGLGRLWPPILFFGTSAALYLLVYWGMGTLWERGFVRKISLSMRGRRFSLGGDRLSKAAFYP
jgi:ABC-type transport system involved in multi-copper enzyme maturation permease subunit